MADVRRFPGDLPPIWLLLALLVMWALHGWLPIGSWLWWPWTLLGWLVIAAATGLIVLCAGRFRRRKTGIRPFSEATTLVIDGAYRFTRNPMYVGFLAICVGTTMCHGTWSPLFVLPLIFWVLHRRFVCREEVFLRQRFGEEYDEYTRRVRRWL